MESLDRSICEGRGTQMCIYIYIRKERSERRVFALFHFVCILFLYLYCVSIDFCATERILFCLNPPLPQRQFSKKKKNVPGLCLTPSSPHGLCRSYFFVFFFGSFCFFLEFWKIGILENWNLGFLMSCDILNFQFPWK